MSESDDQSPAPGRNSSLEAMYDLTDDFSTLSADELNPSFASIEQENKRYDLLEEIATGGMKRIYRTYDRLTRRDVAMAVLAPDVSKDYFDPFIHEAWITAKLDHPNIIRIHDLGVNEEARPFFTMDLKTGNSLQQTVPAGVELQPLDIFSKICEAIAFAHSKGILHLDLKPANIQIGQYGGVVVCDWGLAKFTENDVTLESEIGSWDLDSESLSQTKTLHGQIKGTPGYMAPEQIKQDQAKTVQTDIYGLGCILYFLLAREPILSGSDKEILQQTLAANLKDRVQQSKQIPKPLRAIITRCTQQSPKDRYASVVELLDDVRRYENGYSPVAEETGFLSEAGLFYQRNRKLCLVVNGSLLALALLTSIFIFYLIESRQSEQQSRLRAEESEQRAKKALQLYEDEKLALNELDQDYSSSLRDFNALRGNSFFYQKPKQALAEIIQTQSELIAKNPDDQQLLSNNASILAIKLDFASALKNLKSVDTPSSNGLKELSKRYANDPRLSQGQSPAIDDFIEVLQSARELAPSNHKLVIRMFIYDYTTRKNKAGYERVVKEMIHYYNPDWTSIIYEYNPETRHLRIGGDNLTKPAGMMRFEKRSLLAYIKIRSLDISNTDVYNLSHFQHLTRLEAFNISGTLIASPPSIELFPRLKTLTVSPGQFTNEQMETLSNWVTVIQE